MSTSFNNDYKIFPKVTGNQNKFNDVIVLPFQPSNDNSKAKYNLIFFSGDVQVCYHVIIEEHT